MGERAPANADVIKEGGGGCSMLSADKRGKGSKMDKKVADVICERSLITKVDIGS